MIELQHVALRGESAISNLSRSRPYAEQMNRQFTRKSLTEWLNVAREPWRAYCPWRPDDMPPKGGDPRALAKLEADHAGS